MIGATARKSGKTELATQIIRTFSRSEKIVGIKVTTVQRGDDAGHGSEALGNDFCFISPYNPYDKKANIKNANKSTNRMIAAGAHKAIWINSRIGYLLKTWNEDVYSWLDKKSFIVCESASLRRFIEPDIFIMIRNLDKKFKPSTQDLIGLADIVVDFRDGLLMNFDINSIAVRNGKWMLNKP